MRESLVTRTRHLPRLLLAASAAAFGVGVMAWAGAAYAVSGGGYQPAQQACQPGDDDYATPNGLTYAGCHNTALNVESGGTTQGNPDDGNVRYLSFGNNQGPNDPNSQGTPTLYSIGLPGYTGDPHSGCLALNTDGTTGGPVPAGTLPESPGKAEQYQGGCGNNPNGLGFEANYDYYQFYCPIAKLLGFACEDADPGITTVTPDTGSTIDYQPILDNGLLVYFGMDDNNDNGEHDGLGPFSALTHQNNNGAVNGPSDGGAITLSLTPKGITQSPSPAHPQGLTNLSTGFCADGICIELTTQQQTVYHGCGASNANGQAPCDPGTPSSANVYDYAPGGNPANDPSVSTESPNCNSGDANTTSEKSCGPAGMNATRSATPANENAEPGLQLYADPDPQRSPAAPSPAWPTPAIYVGSCGIYLGSPATTGKLLGDKPISLGGVQIVNAAGQLAIDPAPGSC
jgi:hypothetical protein